MAIFYSGGQAILRMLGALVLLDGRNRNTISVESKYRSTDVKHSTRRHDLTFSNMDDEE